MMVGLLVVLNYYSDIPSTRRSKIDSNTILIKVKTDGWIVRTKSKVWIWLFLVCTEFKDLLLIITWIPFLLHRDPILVVNTIWLNWTKSRCQHRKELNFGYFRKLSAQRQNYWWNNSCRTQSLKIHFSNLKLYADLGRLKHSL